MSIKFFYYGVEMQQQFEERIIAAVEGIVKGAMAKMETKLAAVEGRMKTKLTALEGTVKMTTAELETQFEKAKTDIILGHLGRLGRQGKAVEGTVIKEITQVKSNSGRMNQPA